MRVRQNPKCSCRVGESSFFNILKNIKWQSNLSSRLVLFKYVRSENEGFNNILHSFWIKFESILDPSEGRRKLPRAAWSQTGPTEHPGVAPMAPWDPSWRSKTIQNHSQKQRCSQQREKNSFSFQTREHLENWAVVVVQLHLSSFSLTNKKRPSSIFNTFKEWSIEQKEGARLQVFEDA